MSELHKAMAAAFPKIQGAVAQKTNPQFGSKYADLGCVIEAIKPALSENGLWFTQIIQNVPGCAAIETIIMHSSGESLSCGVVSIPIGKPTAQGYGSALTYARRYSLSAAFGVAPEEDDDGNAASEVQKSGSYKVCAPPPALLTEKEVRDLSKKIVIAIQNDDELNSALNEEEVFIFLQDWQKIEAIVPKVEKMLSSSRERILGAFCSWKAKHFSKKGET